VHNFGYCRPYVADGFGGISVDEWVAITAIATLLAVTVALATPFIIEWINSINLCNIKVQIYGN